LRQHFAARRRKSRKHRPRGGKPGIDLEHRSKNQVSLGVAAARGGCAVNLWRRLCERQLRDNQRVRPLFIVSPPPAVSPCHREVHRSCSAGAGTAPPLRWIKMARLGTLVNPEAEWARSRVSFSTDERPHPLLPPFPGAC
jgi:hypothetical protein